MHPPPNYYCTDMGVIFSRKFYAPVVTGIREVRESINIFFVP